MAQSIILKSQSKSNASTSYNYYAAASNSSTVAGKDIYSEKGYTLIGGTAGNDTITTAYSAKFATINAGAGDDKIYSKNAYSAQMNGEDGNDSLNNSSGRSGATLNGGKGNDTLLGSSSYGDVFIYAEGDGDDIIRYYDVKDTIKVTSDVVDSSVVSGSDVVLKIGDGSITLKDAKGKAINLVNNRGKKLVVGDTSGRNTFYNENSNTVISGTAGNDTIENNKGSNVTINAGAGNDSISNTYGYKVAMNGGEGNDYISNISGRSIATLNGGKGKDTLVGARNWIDVFVYADGDGDDTVVLYNNEDYIKVTSGVVDSSVVSGSDVVLKIGDGSMTIKDGKSKTLNLIDNSGKKITVGASSSTSTTSGGSSTDTTAGGSSTSTVKGSSIKNYTDNKTVTGGAGNDTIKNLGDNLKISAGAGDDLIQNIGDNVTISGGKGDDTISASFGAEVFNYANGDGNDTILNYAANDTINITSSSYSTQNSGQDVIIKVGEGSITLKNSKGVKLNITRTSNFEERWFLNNSECGMQNDELSSILDNKSSDIVIESKHNVATNFLQKTLMSLTSNKRDK